MQLAMYDVETFGIGLRRFELYVTPHSRQLEIELQHSHEHPEDYRRICAAL